MLFRKWNEKRIRPRLWLLDLQIFLQMNLSLRLSMLRTLSKVLKKNHNIQLTRSLGLVNLLHNTNGWILSKLNYKTRLNKYDTQSKLLLYPSINVRRGYIVSKLHKKCLLSGRARGLRFGFSRMPLLAKNKTPWGVSPGLVRW